MYGTLSISQRALDDLRDAAGNDAIEELRRLARPLEGLRVLNLSVTGFGTGTAELLNSAVPLLTDLGLDCHWQVLRGSEESAQATRDMYRGLGGQHVSWTQELTDAWLRYAQLNAGLLTERFDVIIVHDPQPAAIRSYVDDTQGTKWVLHSHLDLSTAQEEVWLPLREHVEKFDAAIFESPEFARRDITIPVHIIPPAIDPNSARNMPVPNDVIRSVLSQYGLDADKPLVLQVSPCDAESDLVGAVDSVCELRDRFPDLQLALVLTTEPQDPAARASFDDLSRRCADEGYVHVIEVGHKIGNVEFNVFQRAASVVMQRGLRKGYGMWVSDALWKQRPVVCGGAPGLREQVVHGETGLVAEQPPDFTAYAGDILADPSLGERLGRNGRRRVADRFLITRYLRDQLVLLSELNRSLA
jgi:trehalose synthase